MKLEEFIKETLVSIVNGVDSAKNEIDSSEAKGKINPGLRQVHAVDTSVDFDIGLSVSNDSQTHAEITVFSFFKAKAEGSSGKEESSQHRIKFKVPVQFS